MGVGVWGLGCGVWGLGFGVWGLGLQFGCEATKLQTQTRDRKADRNDLGLGQLVGQLNWWGPCRASMGWGQGGGAGVWGVGSGV